jgi:hypothetical protein
MKKLLLVIFAAIILPSMLYSQSYLTTSKYRAPFFALEGTFGYALPIFDLTGSSVGDFYSFKNYATSWGYDASVKLKFTVANFKPSQLRLSWMIGFARFMGDYNNAYGVGEIKTPFPRPTYVPPAPISGGSSIYIDQPYTAVGMDYVVFADRKRISLFSFGGDIAMSVPFGKVFDTPTGQGESYNNILSATRFGFGITVGYTARVTEFMGLTVSTRYQMSNLLGKSSEVTTENRDIAFNDGEDRSLHPGLGSRTIGYLGFNGGVTFYFGGKK